jgi:hypothetical protein
MLKLRAIIEIIYKKAKASGNPGMFGNATKW